LNLNINATMDVVVDERSVLVRRLALRESVG